MTFDYFQSGLFKIACKYTGSEIKFSFCGLIFLYLLLPHFPVLHFTFPILHFTFFTPPPPLPLYWSKTQWRKRYKYLVTQIAHFFS